MDITVASDSMKGAHGAMYVIRECMDEAFLRHMGPASPAHLLFGDHRSHRWRKAVLNYMDEVIAKLPSVIVVIGSMDAPIDEQERQAFASMEWCVAKVKILRWFQGRSDPEASLCMMPFMSRSVYNHMVGRLEVVSKAIAEVRLVCSCYLSRISTCRRNVQYIYTCYSAHFDRSSKCAIHTYELFHAFLQLVEMCNTYTHRISTVLSLVGTDD
ncbi:hypothetical protein JVT61DRAFT_12326 [Boletus reticuloceps]|uniref:Uncharacterized protein n=1 Tax=Boletus reticuloceps TaxID=495285 RepID=A0A8I2YE09_9AGAM|nr:hypothetical protein JVT61DRAFT_12326 [Boletus reticuloceps]